MVFHLRTHSYYSLQEALPSPQQLATEAARTGMKALGLTDHRLLSGAVEFHQACTQAGIQPILGLDVDLSLTVQSNNVTVPCSLYAESHEGWKNLCRISTEWMLNHESGPCPIEVVDNNNAGLIALAGTANLAEPVFRHLADRFPNRLYCELPLYPGQDPATALRISAQAKRMMLPVAASAPVYFLSPDQHSLLRTLAAIRTITPLTKLTDAAAPPVGAFFASPEELSKRFSAFPQALKGCIEIAERCTFRLPLGIPQFPQIPLPPGQTIQQLLRSKAEEGARRLYQRITPELQRRLDFELEVITGRGYEPIFIIMQEILDYARRTGVPVSSRGSAASSLVAHCLGITSPDPIHHNLYFERFLNPARTSPPDIDTDLCSRRRDRVIQYVFEHFGADRVAMVATVNRFRSRSAISDVAKAYGIPPQIIHEMVATLPYHHPSQAGEEGDEPENLPDQLPPAFRSAKYQPILADARAILRLPRHLSVHPGGVVIAPGPMTDFAPVMRSGSKGITITQFDLQSISALGLVKIDLLGIRGLTVLGDVAEAIHSWRRSEFSRPMEVLDAIPEQDAAVSARLEQAQTIGCFQIESPGMRATLREINARTMDDIIVALALYRPGPLQGGLKEAFVRRYKGEEPVTHLHPALAPLLQDTFGVILYQEQVLRIAHELAGLSLSDADLLRRAMSHFDPGKQMQLLKQRFIAGALQHNQVPEEIGERIWQLMAAFAGYGFPKAHAVSYAQVAWRTAWCKTHYPAEFMAAVLANWGGYYSQRVYLNESRRMGLNVQPPHVNHSKREFSVQYPGGETVLYMGLDQVRDLSARTQQRLLSLRPFTSLQDLVTRCDPRPVEIRNLIACGALKGLGPIPVLLRQLEEGVWKPGQPSLFNWQVMDEPDWPVEQRVQAQFEILGASVDAHPVEIHRQQIVQSGAMNTVQAYNRTGQRVKVAGVRQVFRRSRTAAGDWMAFLTLEDLDGTLDVIFRPDIYRKYRSALGSNALMIIEGQMQDQPGRNEPVLLAERMDLLT